MQQLSFTMNKKTLKFHAKEQERGHRMIIHAKKKVGKDRLGDADPNTYGGIVVALVNVQHQEFGKELTEHNVFLCSDNYKIQQLPDGKHTVLTVLSEENLLMNAYHRQQTVQDMFTCIDAS